MRTVQAPFLAHLGLDAEADEKAIRRAYARRLKQIDQATQADEFQALHAAYQTALAWHASRDAHADDTAWPDTEAAAGDGADTESSEPDPPPAPDASESSGRHRSIGETVDPMLRDLAARIEQAPPDSLAAARRLLVAFLDDSALIDLDCRMGFEWGVAAMLANGWRPGHEHLFGAALESFDWREDRRRLAALGGPGFFMHRAIEELESYNAQPAVRRDYERDAIRRLRNPDRPRTWQLLRHLPVAERLRTTFPHMMHVLTSTANIDAWHGWHETVPMWRRKLAGTGPSKPVAAKSTRARWEMAAIVFVVLQLLVVIVKVLGAPAPPDPTRLAGGRDWELARQSTASKPAADTTDVFTTPPQPRYPPEARRLGQEGTVTVGIQLDRKGALVRANVLQSSGHRLLDEEALAAVRNAQYPSYPPIGEATKHHVISLRFKLDD